MSTRFDSVRVVSLREAESRVVASASGSLIHEPSRAGSFVPVYLISPWLAQAAQARARSATVYSQVFMLT
jgi:hypothetical protein